MNATTTLSAPAALVRGRVPLRARKAKGTAKKATRIVRSALISSEPAEAPGDGELGRSTMKDPLSAMMNFISELNPLASVFSSPSGEAQNTTVL